MPNVSGVVAHAAVRYRPARPGVRVIVYETDFSAGDPRPPFVFTVGELGVAGQNALPQFPARVLRQP